MSWWFYAERNGPEIVTSIGWIESIWKQAILNLDAPKNLVPCTGSALLFWVDFVKNVVTGKKPVASREGEPCVHMVRVLLPWQHGVPWPGGLQL